MGMIFSFRSLTENAGALTKGGLDKPSFAIDFTDGCASGTTITSTFATAVTSSNATTANLVSTTSVSGYVVSVFLLTGGSSGTGEATNGERFRIRTTATLSNSVVLTYDNFVYIANVSYDPA